jgi:hypothetical protein
MNKFIKYLAIILCIGLITGCSGKKEEKKLSENISSEIKISEEGASAVCHADFDYTNTRGFVTGSKMVIFTDSNNIVTKVSTQEIAESNDKSVLSILEESIKENYSVASQYGGYDYDVSLNGNRLIITTTIDYTVLDMEKMATDNDTLEVYLNKDHRFTLASIQSMYMAVGAECVVK